ncbi:acetate/propionate family kinase [Halothermothrix orenii]|uniref:Acetate kinase n=1 Tax=Halothermothrix orenii (strain H 168 / OCM 544 / DSM 9562) TaxID=373903 RepID=ACKA_HALOH|nr:acetate kinase [Halothermothrix orenii]B8CWV8.1 RecName: Full=Acetate kinase; AltName: Full=Acetokinase [Halothermothrix orenii H 168]ACL69777.1 acetate kinase [Halothermothrix orenii H 168]
MKILVLNSGSSSLKYQLFDMEKETVMAKGVVQRIGIDNSFLEHENYRGEETTIETDIPDHNRGIQLVIDTLQDEKYGVLNNMEEIDAVGHRVVHGGEKFAESTLITDEVIKQIEEVSELAPLHNPHNLTGIRVCSKLMPGIPQVAVFDTAFHQTMPRKAYVYALPYEYYEKYGIRRYGFHGTSHKYVAERAARLMDKPLEELKIITCHLGNGASVAAIDAGKSVDTSMGLTPLEGLVMGTRCGDIDPAIIPFIMDKENLDIKEVDNVLNKKSGLYGVSGISNDSRDVEEASKDGNERATIALEIFKYRVKKYIGAYTAVMGGVDAVVFTAGIGENAIEMRESIVEELGFLGVKLDRDANNNRGKEIEISTKDSRTKIFVIPTNEELVIARDTARIVES